MDLTHLLFAFAFSAFGLRSAPPVARLKYLVSGVRPAVTSKAWAFLTGAQDQTFTDSDGPLSGGLGSVRDRAK